jgi:hypothetical protein
MQKCRGFRLDLKVRNGHSRQIHETRALLTQICQDESHFSRKWPLASVSKSGESAQHGSVSVGESGESAQHGSANVGESGESAQHGSANVGESSTRNAPQTCPRVLVTFAKFELAKFTVEWPLLTYKLIFWINGSMMRRRL